MLINYKTLSGCEITYFNGKLHIWVPDGMYVLKAATLKPHGAYSGYREVLLYLYDTECDRTKIKKETYDPSFDDYEIIYRWIVGTASCDCVRGRKLYGPTLSFKCNRGPNRFILKKMVIKGEKSNCVISYKGYK